VTSQPIERISGTLVAVAVRASDIVTSSFFAPANLVLIDAQSGTITQLTDDDHRDINPSWSSDGQRVALSSNRTGQYEIHVIERDGTGLVQVTDGDGNKYHPTWSPDGERLAFISNLEQDERYTALNVIDIESRQVTTVIKIPLSPGDPAIRSIEWSPVDESLILLAKYESLRPAGENRDTKAPYLRTPRDYLLDLQTGIETLITPDGWTCGDPVWSPAGKMILQNCCRRLIAQDGSCAPIVGKLMNTETGFALEELRELAGITGSWVSWSFDGEFWARSGSRRGIGFFEIHEIQPYMTYGSYSSDGMVATGLYLYPTPLIEDDMWSLSEPDWGP